MKGLQERTGGNGIFLSIKHHGIVQESKRERDGFEPINITLRSGEVITKYIKRYSGVEAMIKKIEWYDREYDGRPYKGWKLLLDANGTACVLDIDFNSRQAGRFMKLAENLDFSKPVEFSAWHDVKDDTTAFNVKQDGASVRQKYTMDDPGDCPPPKERMGGKLDFGDQEDFLFNRMIKVVIPRVDAANSNGHSPEPESNTEQPPAPAVSRDTLQAEITSLCKQLNQAGDTTKWGKATLIDFINQEYSVEDGMDSLSTPFMVELKAVLNKRLLDLDIPF